MVLRHDFGKNLSLSCILLFSSKFLKIKLLAQVAQEGSWRGSGRPKVRDLLTVWGLALDFDDMN